jgi:hypothetical protein
MYLLSYSDSDKFIYGKKSLIKSTTKLSARLNTGIISTENICGNWDKNLKDGFLYARPI